MLASTGCFGQYAKQQPPKRHWGDLKPSFFFLLYSSALRIERTEERRKVEGGRPWFVERKGHNRWQQFEPNNHKIKPNRHSMKLKTTKGHITLASSQPYTWQNVVPMMLVGSMVAMLSLTWLNILCRLHCIRCPCMNVFTWLVIYSYSV